MVELCAGQPTRAVASETQRVEVPLEGSGEATAGRERKKREIEKEQVESQSMRCCRRESEDPEKDV